MSVNQPWLRLLRRPAHTALLALATGLSACGESDDSAKPHGSGGSDAGNAGDTVDGTTGGDSSGTGGVGGSAGSSGSGGSSETGDAGEENAPGDASDPTGPIDPTPAPAAARLLPSGNALNSTPPVLAATGDGIVVAGATSDPELAGVEAFGAGITAEAFVAAFDRAGRTVWTTALPDAGMPSDVAVNHQGEVVVLAPWLPEATSLMRGQYSNSGYLAKLTDEGELIFERELAFGDATILQALAMDAAGAMYLAGSRYPEDDFPNEYPFLAKYDQDGVEVWSKSFEHDGSTSYFSSMAVDAADSLALVGVFNGSMNLGGDDLVTDALVGSSMLPNGFVARFTADGDHIHSGQFGGTIFDGGNAIAPLANGDLLVGGWLSGVANVGGQTVTADEEDGSAFVARLDASLEARWVELAATAGATQAIATDSDGESFWAVGDFGGSEYLVEYSASGMAAQVASTVSGALVSTSAAVDPFGGLWIAGMFTGELDLGNGNQFDGGPAGVCLVRLDRALPSR